MSQNQDLPGNSFEYSPNNAVKMVNSPLQNKNIAFLGSSITLGAGSLGKSFVDYLVVQDGINATKSAINGTTLAGNEPNGYLDRLQREIILDKNYDVFVCQLSTNDTRNGKKLGTISDEYQLEQFDIQTTIGAIEYIIAYVKKQFNCPIIFYTCLRTKLDTDYQILIDQLYALSKKWDFTILDLNHDIDVNHQTETNLITMVDDSHPTQAGYYNIWTPKFRTILTKVLS